MPNLHYLDATSIALLHMNLSKENITNLYTIHDCFATTADNVKILIDMLKGVYISIYSQDGYIASMVKHIKQTIENTFGSNIFTEDKKKLR